MTLNVEKVFNSHCRFIHNMPGLTELFNTHSSIVMSWGAHDFKSFQDMALRFTVNGHHHKGNVFIFLHLNNTYEVYLTDNKAKIKEQINDINIDALIDTLDKKIDWIEGYKQ